MKDYSFRSIVFFGSKTPYFKPIQKDFANYDFIKVFKTNNIDELDQILQQSVLTAIVVNDRDSIRSLTNQNVVGHKDAGVRIYYLDVMGSLSRKEMSNLSLNRVTTIKDVEHNDLKRRLELFILGKYQLSTYKELKKSDDDPSSKKSYFTHFRLDDNQWVAIASTHEQEKDIETFFQRSWSVYCLEVQEQAGKLSSFIIDPDFNNDYQAIIFPHHYPDGRKALSIIHIKKDEENFEELTQKALSFLATI
jgi:hypothetical protein